MVFRTGTELAIGIREMDDCRTGGQPRFPKGAKRQLHPSVPMLENASLRSSVAAAMGRKYLDPGEIVMASVRWPAPKALEGVPSESPK